MGDEILTTVEAAVYDRDRCEHCGLVECDHVRIRVDLSTGWPIV